MLNRSDLESALLDFFLTPKDAVTAGQRFAKLYADYASTAVSCAGGIPTAITVSASRRVLATTLVATFKSSFDLRSTTSRIGTAIAVFWTTVVFGPPAALPSAPPVALAPPLIAALQTLAGETSLAVVSGRAPPTAQIAAQWATVLDTWTRTVVVTHPLVPTPCVGPIS